MLVNPIIFGNGGNSGMVKTLTFTGDGNLPSSTNNTPAIIFPEKPRLILAIEGWHDYNKEENKTYGVSCGSFFWGTTTIPTKYYGLKSLGIGNETNQGTFNNVVAYAESGNSFKIIFTTSSETSGDAGRVFNGEIWKNGSLVGSTYTVFYIPESAIQQSGGQ